MRSWIPAGACGAAVILCASCSVPDGIRCRGIEDAPGRQVAKHALQELIRENQLHDVEPNARTLHDVVAGIDIDKLQKLPRQHGDDPRLYRFSAQGAESTHRFRIAVSDNCETEFFVDD